MQRAEMCNSLETRTACLKSCAWKSEIRSVDFENLKIAVYFVFIYLLPCNTIHIH